MKVGSLVERYKDYGELDVTLVCGIVPEKYTPYTVREINIYGLYLEEIINHMGPFAEWGYETMYFRELQPPMEISIEELLKEPQTV